MILLRNVIFVFESVNYDYVSFDLLSDKFFGPTFVRKSQPISLLV